ncbi:TcaA NTF2-like domain-containing protein [Niallia taxi]|uniref:TcaA NTF2-like domain-containing protein n=1 Tax=Niallia taxi TaxID=2499688 RepID=UPI000FD791D0
MLSVSAINAGEFSHVSSYLDPNGKAYTESKDYVKYIYEKGITEEVVSVEVTDYEKPDDGYVVDTNDVYDITSKDGTTKRQEFKSSLDGTLGVNELISTKNTNYLLIPLKTVLTFHFKRRKHQVVNYY